MNWSSWIVLEMTYVTYLDAPVTTATFLSPLYPRVAVMTTGQLWDNNFLAERPTREMADLDIVELIWNRNETWNITNINKSINKLHKIP